MRSPLCISSTYRKWGADSATQPLNGAHAVRKPDLSCWLAPDSKFDWRHLATFAEVKNRDGKDNEKSSYIETAGKMSCLLYAQDGRHSAPCIRILGSRIYLTIFDRGGSLSTCGYDIHRFPHDFLRILIGVTSASLHVLGFDVLIDWRQTFRDGDRSPVDVKEIKIQVDPITQYIIKLTKVLFISDNLFGRGTTVWGGVTEIGEVVVKDSWIDPLRKYMEGYILRVLNAHKIEGVPTLIHEQQVRAPYPSTIKNLPVNSSTHFVRSDLNHAQYEASNYYLRTLSRLVTQPIGDLITEFSCLGELLVAFVDYIAGE